ncbi:hypothetical protein Ddye_014419 [Dipteronia dyeriana]|uniref:Uncharacterized protein n=1 Tax=Dipteronia dyeriana TaxID=168575 RepID=A0AAD9X8T0_9ROSI|nr:hypothetical protein Ddye_014419 [Dipteronia dyeriana]
MPRMFSFPNMKQYDETTDPYDHIAQYKKQMFTAANPRNLRETCMCRGFESSLMGPTLQWNSLLHDSNLYKELTKYPCRTMEDILAKAWAQIKWEEDKAN